MNRRLASTTTATISCALAIWGQAAIGQSFSSGSSGADGAFAPLTNQNITVRPGGVYHYTSVNIPAGVTVRYFRNTDNAPVVILASGNVTIDGAIVVSGLDSVFPPNETPALGVIGGPGGSTGGNGGNIGANILATAGHGPAGGAAGIFNSVGGQGGNYGAPTLFVGLTPLFGGSGGGGGAPSGVNGWPGGGGGGAILIASSTVITVNGAIRANGGNGGAAQTCGAMGGPGSGGAIRLVAPQIAGTGGNSLLQALPGTFNGNCQAGGGPGRIRLEASNMQGFTGLTNPTPSIANAPGPVSPGGNPALANVPTLAIASVGGTAVPAAATASYSVPDIALAPGTPNPIAVVVNATNTPVGSPTEIKVRLIPRGTASTVTVPASAHTGSFATSSATANVTLAAGQVTVLQALASMTLTGQFASLFPLIDGEPVERVTVAANLGEASTLSLVTKAGKERRLDELPIEDQLLVARAWEAMKNVRAE
jgi:hypothetical protein